MKKISKFIIGPVILASGSLTGLTTLVSCTNDNDVEDNAIYRLQFNNENNLGDNTGSRTSLKDATLVGRNMKVSGEHKDSHVLSFSGEGINYLKLPTKALKNETTTLAMWLKVPKYENNDSNRSLFGISTDKGYFYVSPFDKDTWNSFAIHSGLDGQDKNLTKVPASDKTFAGETPLDGTLQPIFDAWQLIGFTFTNEGLTVYQNGKKILSYSGNYRLKDLDINSFKIGIADDATGLGFRGAISDVRIYNKPLNEQDYQDEFNTSYTDYNTINMDFAKQNLKDSARGYDGGVRPEALQNVKYETIVDESGKTRNVVHLDANPNQQGDERAGFYLPKGSLMGHHELTISTDIYVKPRRDQGIKGQRIFDFASNNNTIGTHGERFMGFYYTMYDLNRCRIGTITDADRFSGETWDNWTTDPNFTLPIDKWVNLTTVFTKDTTKLLLNGTVVMEGHNAPWTPSLFYDYDNCDFFVGRPNQGGSPSLPCYIDNFKVWSTALTDKDIQDSMGNIHIKDDKSAVDDAMDTFSISECYRPGKGRIYPSCHVGDGVLTTIKSENEDIIDKDGFLLYSNEEQTCPVTVTLSRGKYSLSKTIDVIVPKVKDGKKVVENNPFSNEAYVKGADESLENSAYQWLMQKSTFDWMTDLDREKLLYMYRVTAGLAEYHPDWHDYSYGSWIRPGCGGEGQFQGEYIGALARASNYSQYDRISDLRAQMKYLMDELEKCQNAYPNAPYGEGQDGYLNGFSHLAYVDVAQGRDDVQRGRYPELPLDDHIWVPWYMYHKQIMMCYDVMTYATMDTDQATQQIRKQAEGMFLKAAGWAANFVLSLSAKQREKTLRMEYGGMGEAMYCAYRVALNKGLIPEAKQFLKAARFFEETYFIEEAYYNSNVLSGIHVNTLLPKFNSCCAAYQATGDEFYLKATENEWQLIVDSMTMANGGISSIGEHFEEPGHATQARFGEETCCSYNMLRVTDYLYRFTGESKYMHYFEQVWYNHILPSIDMVGSYWAGEDDPFRAGNQKKYDALEVGGKAYVMSTDFGHHITYSSSDDSFWCCVATGTESYSKLTYGNFYNGTEDGLTYVNMYNNITANTTNGNLTISGINPGTDYRKSEYVDITTSDTNLDLSKFRFLRPKWLAEDTAPVITIDGGSPVQYTVDENDYITITDASLSSGQTLRMTLPMEITPVEQRGYLGDGDKKYSYALYYGPYMIVPDLGVFDGDEPQPGQLYQGDIYIHNGNGSDQSGQKSYEDKGGAVTQTIQLVEGKTISDSITKSLNDVEITDPVTGHAHFTGLEFSFDTANNGTLTYRPFMDINYERYSFYMYFAVPFYPE